MLIRIFFVTAIVFVYIEDAACNKNNLPIVVTTWKFISATEKAWNTILNKSAIDAVEVGCSVCEMEQCDGSVGYGGHPDEDGETTLDAMIMDGNTMNVGAVAAIRRIMNAVSVARHVLEKTSHSMLAGDLATQFAVQMGFKEESLSTRNSKEVWNQWKGQSCQPNFWQNVNPDPESSCGPYRPELGKEAHSSRDAYKIGIKNHDTISMLAIDNAGNVAAGTSTNGANHKIPGRVGDSPIPGAGAYADSSVGAAAATGDGDVMLRFLPSFLAVEEMRRGTSPTDAAQIAIGRIISYYPNFVGAVIAVNRLGAYGASCHGIESFPFSVADKKSNTVRLESVPCIESSHPESIMVV